MISNCPICYKPLDTGFRCLEHGNSPIIPSPMSMENVVMFIHNQIQSTMNYGISKIEVKLNEIENRFYQGKHK